MSRYRFLRDLDNPTRFRLMICMWSWWNNSPDGSAGIVRELMSAFPNLHLSTGDKRGRLGAYKRGIAYALKHLQADLIFE